ncbi:roadblock/LC7 domain-containing protein [Nocardiopsis metallicus]|uniref:Putative regulator of Ras-like GTPase activity (Roadblock/LC7/MglB family) n=1 Tax=Nocardiopsis metallicus TaxID=179819 RepID=A0A840WKG1_9ACTN|nr:roadblock/LC7 domain-containing protein [Nocardiopsis metallicus]MBB5493481.1 putative regulator of Ras-like GTPase activity (Roadblock/LC7/MglB family) [Nocardiopsis metallicus]
MVSAVHPGQESDLSWLLSNLVDRVPHTRSVVLLSSDGLMKAVSGLDVESAEQLAAIASGLFSLSRGAGLKFGGNETVRQVIVELDNTLLFVASAGSGSVLAVLAGREADAGVLGYEMSQLINSVRPFLTTPTRSTDQRSR